MHDTIVQIDLFKPTCIHTMKFKMQQSIATNIAIIKEKHMCILTHTKCSKQISQTIPCRRENTYILQHPKHTTRLVKFAFQRRKHSHTRTCKSLEMFVFQRKPKHIKLCEMYKFFCLDTLCIEKSKNTFGRGFWESLTQDQLYSESTSFIRCSGFIHTQRSYL